MPKWGSGDGALFIAGLRSDQYPPTFEGLGLQRGCDIDGAVWAVRAAAALRAGSAAAVFVAGFRHGPGDGEPPGLQVHVTASEGADLTVPGAREQREAPLRVAQREEGLSFSAGEGIAFARRLAGDDDRLGDVADDEALVDRIAESVRCAAATVAGPTPREKTSTTSRRTCDGRRSATTVFPSTGTTFVVTFDRYACTVFGFNRSAASCSHRSARSATRV